MTAIVQEIEEYKKDFYEDNPDYENYSDSEIRQEIVNKLNDVALFINPVKLDKDYLESEFDAPDVSNICIKSGTCLALSRYVLSNDYTYKIESGKPVCLDLSSAIYVTGINPEWSKEEYKVLGIALDDNYGNDEGGISLIRIDFNINDVDYIHEATRCWGVVAELFDTDDSWIKVKNIRGINGKTPGYIEDDDFEIYVYNHFSWSGDISYDIKFELDFNRDSSVADWPDGVTDERLLEYRGGIWSAYQLECD